MATMSLMAGSVGLGAIWVLAQVPADDRPRAVIGVVLVLALAGVGIGTLVRRAVINRRRRARGVDPLSGGQIAASRMTAAQLGSTATDEELAAALELARQRAWEQEQAASEMLKHGRSGARAYCAEHDRWCKYPERGEHPPGGFDNETAPAGWFPPGEGPPIGGAR